MTITTASEPGAIALSQVEDEVRTPASPGSGVHTH